MSMKAAIYRHKNGTLYLGVVLIDGSIDYTMCDDVISTFNHADTQNLEKVSDDFEIRETVN